ncbi:MAG: histidine kinase [Fimbriiglobus sp.]|jgi:hypothetical protein|nr:histidine kinase [Fimbriiglobus sp.]
MNKRSDDAIRSADTIEVQALPAVVAAHAAVEPKKSDDEKMHIFWRVFGGAILSVTAFAGFTLYNTLTSNIAELRTENSRLREDAVTFRTRADDNRREIDAMKERLSKYRLELDAAKKDAGTATDAVKKDVTAVEKDLQKALAEVREKVARLEGQQKPPAEGK